MDKIVPAPPASELQCFTTTPDLSFEDALTHASSVLPRRQRVISWRVLYARW